MIVVGPEKLDQGFIIVVVVEELMVWSYVHGAAFEMWNFLVEIGMLLCPRLANWSYCKLHQPHIQTILA